MSSHGLNRETGRAVFGWDHIKQSLNVIIETALHSRIIRRPFGSNLESKIDKPQNLFHIVDLYIGVAEAIEPRLVEGFQMGEPRFALSSIEAIPSASGVVALNLSGVVYPNGHLGDFTASHEVSVEFQF